jgi:hypothetical protein
MPALGLAWSSLAEDDVELGSASRRRSELGDREIRLRVLDRLGALSRGRVVEEVALLRGQIRVDIALISSRLEAFEIKSELDTLARLPKQRVVYNRVFDRVTLVAAERHLESAERSAPRWWGLWVAGRRDGYVEVEELRPAQDNPSVDVRALVQLLWKEEAVALLHAHGVIASSRSNRRDLCEEIIEQVPASDVRSAVTHALRWRRDWRPS